MKRFSETARIAFGDDTAALAEKQPIGAFADQNKVAFKLGGDGERRVLSLADSDGADARKEVERFADFDLERDFRTVGITDIRQSHGCQEDGIGVSYLCHGR